MKKILVLLFTSVCLILPALANSSNKTLNLTTINFDGVNPVKHKKKVVRVKKKKKVKKGIRAIVRKLSPKIPPQPFTYSVKPRVTFQVTCSEDKVVLIRITPPKDAFIIEDKEFSFVELDLDKLNTISDKDELYKLVVMVAQTLKQVFQLKSVVFRYGIFIFEKPDPDINLNLVQPALKEILVDYDPYEIYPRFGCTQDIVAKITP